MRVADRWLQARSTFPLVRAERARRAARQREPGAGDHEPSAGVQGSPTIADQAGQRRVRLGGIARGSARPPPARRAASAPHSRRALTRAIGSEGKLMFLHLPAAGAAAPKAASGHHRAGPGAGNRPGDYRDRRVRRRQPGAGRRAALAVRAGHRDHGDQGPVLRQRRPGRVPVPAQAAAGHGRRPGPRSAWTTSPARRSAPFRRREVGAVTRLNGVAAAAGGLTLNDTKLTFTIPSQSSGGGFGGGGGSSRRRVRIRAFPDSDQRQRSGAVRQRCRAGAAERRQAGFRPHAGRLRRQRGRSARELELCHRPQALGGVHGHAGQDQLQGRRGGLGGVGEQHRRLHPAGPRASTRHGAGQAA